MIFKQKLTYLISFRFYFQAPELEFRHELMGRLNKLDTEIELEVVPGNNNNNLHHNNLNSSSSPSSSSGLSNYGGCTSNGYDNGYQKEYYYGKILSFALFLLCTPQSQS